MKFREALGKNKNYRKIRQHIWYYINRNVSRDILKKDEEEIKIQKQFPKKIAIIFQGTQNYIKMLPNYYYNLKKFFLPNTKKDFFVMTDQLDFPLLKNEDIFPIFQEHDKIVMLRAYEHLLKAEDKLSEYSHIIWVDADMFLEQELLEKEFFCHDKPLFALRQPNFLLIEGSFEKNPESLAYVAPGEDKSTYIQACFWGGRSKEALELVRELDSRIKKDIHNESMAKLEDEAHLNKYRIEIPDSFYIYPHSYGYPLARAIPAPFKKKIIHGKDENIKVPR